MLQNIILLKHSFSSYPFGTLSLEKMYTYYKLINNTIHQHVKLHENPSNSIRARVYKGIHKTKYIPIIIFEIIFNVLI